MEVTNKIHPSTAVNAFNLPLEIINNKRFVFWGLTSLWSRLQFIVVIVANPLVILDDLTCIALVAETASLAFTRLLLQPDDSL